MYFISDICVVSGGSYCQQAESVTFFGAGGGIMHGDIYVHYSKLEGMTIIIMLIV